MNHPGTPFLYCWQFHSHDWPCSICQQNGHWVYIYYSDGTTRVSGNYIAFDDVFGRINNQLGGVESSDSEDPNQEVAEAAYRENIANNHIIGMQETGTPVNYLIMAFLMILGGLCVLKRKSVLIIDQK